MAIRIEAVKGPDFATHASEVLREAWKPPVLLYSEAYLKWQLSFPSTVPMPAFMAYDGSEAVGFAGMSARRFRCGENTWDSGIASFVAVRPQWRGSPLGIMLYKELFSAFRTTGLPFLGFGVEGGDARKIFMLVLSRTGFEVLPLGATRTNIFILKTEKPASDWEAEVAESASREEASSWVTNDRTVISCDPTQEQWEHYRHDPRGRALILLHNRVTNARGAAWVVRGEYVSRDGIRVVPTIDSLHVPGYDAAALPSLFHEAARWANLPGTTFVNAPNLSGFDGETLRARGVRDSGKGFLAICCSPSTPVTLKDARSTSVEIV